MIFFPHGEVLQNEKWCRKACAIAARGNPRMMFMLYRGVEQPKMFGQEASPCCRKFGLTIVIFCSLLNCWQTG